MADDPALAVRRLAPVMRVVGFALILGIPFVLDVWPAGFRWAHPSVHPPYERMIVAIYISLGICLVLGARDPVKHAIILDFTIISSILHGAVMTYDSFAQEGEMMHLAGDVPLLFALAGLFFFLHPRRIARAVP